MSCDITLQLNANLSSQPFDGDGGHRQLLELDDSRGRTQRLLVSLRAWQALSLLQAPMAETDWLRELHSRGWSEPALERLRQSVLAPARTLNVIVDSESPAHPAAPLQAGKPGYMNGLWPLLSPQWVNPLARLLSPVFSRPGLWAAAGIALLGQALLIHALLQPRLFVSPSSEEILWGLLLLALVVLLHELGHAAAAWRLGARKVSIGVGWYLVFPVAWADLSELWRFPSRSRALVDVAGVLMQAIAVTALMIGYHLGGHALLLAAASAASASVLWNLNPLLRMDGYWLLSDLLGSSHLHRDAKAALGRVWNQYAPRRIHVTVGRAPPLSPAIGAALALYALAATGCFALVCYLAVVRFAAALSDTLPSYARQLTSLSDTQLVIADVVLLIAGLLWQVLICVFIGRFLFRLGRRLMQALYRRRRPTTVATPAEGRAL